MGQSGISNYIMGYSLGKYWWHEKQFLQAELLESNFILVGIWKKILRTRFFSYYIGKFFFKTSQESTGEGLKEKKTLSWIIINL